MNLGLRLSSDSLLLILTGLVGATVDRGIVLPGSTTVWWLLRALEEVAGVERPCVQ